MDEDGYVKITGRVKDMIIRGGENVYPREIEEFLYTHPEVSDVQVYGVPDEKYGEQVAAAVQLRRAPALTAEEVRDYCRENIARFKVPEYVDFVEELPDDGAAARSRSTSCAIRRSSATGWRVRPVWIPPIPTGLG